MKNLNPCICMPKMPQIHVSPSGNGWKTTTDGKTISNHRTQETATKAATKIADSKPAAQVVVHRPDGRIREEHTHGRDPYPPPG